MSNLGGKHICSGCSAKFYDLGKKNPKCPKCELVVKAKTSSKETEVDEVIVSHPDDEPKKQNIDDAGDIDLSEFDEGDKGEVLKSVSVNGEVDDIEDINELEDDIESISELENREEADDRVNSDDSDDNLAMEQSNEENSFVDRISDEEELEFEEE